MARIRQSSEIPPLEIENFLGLNLPQAGDTQIYLGESGNMYNCYINKDYDLVKAQGYLQLMTAVSATKSIQGMWYGDIGGTNYLIFATNGKLYKVDSQLWEDFTGADVWSSVTTELGSLTDAPTQFFAFSEKLYILNGTEYKSYDGTTFGDVAGYIPKITISAIPVTGSGTTFEGANLLIGSKRMTYNGDGTATYQLPETTIATLDSVWVDGVEKTLTTHYTVVTSTGIVTFTAGNFPAEGLDNVEIYWTKGSGTRATVIKNRFPFLFGLAADTRVFMYGNEDDQNVRINSSLAAGVPSAEYFTSTNIDAIGSSSTAITGMERTQAVMLVHKTDETYYAYYDSVDLDGIDTVNFPTPIINETRGNVAFGQTQVLNNEPFTIDRQLLKWVATSNKDERNMKDMGKRIQKNLDAITLSNCLTVDRESSSELFISNAKNVWVYKYDLENPNSKEKGIFSKLQLEDTPTCWLVIGEDIWFGTSTGEIMKLSSDYLTYNGTKISAHWEMNMYDFGSNYYNKTLKKGWITLSAQPKVQIEIQYVTDTNAYSTPLEITYELTTFDDVDYSDFTFYTNYNPQTKYIRMKAKKFLYVKAVLDNDSLTETFSILKLVLQAEYGGERKN